MLKFLLGLIVGACLILVAEYLFVARGGIQMRTDTSAFPMERLLAHQAIVASMGKAEEEQAPVPADESNLLEGARIYQTKGCAGCHGRIDDAQSGGGKYFYPHAPHLLPPSKGVTDDQVGETHWVVKNGIRFSAMPSYGTRLSETEVWQVSQLLHNADKLPASVQEALRAAPAGSRERRDNGGSTSSATPGPTPTPEPSASAAQP